MQRSITRLEVEAVLRRECVARLKDDEPGGEA